MKMFFVRFAITMISLWAGASIAASQARAAPLDQDQPVSAPTSGAASGALAMALGAPEAQSSVAELLVLAPRPVVTLDAEGDVPLEQPPPKPRFEGFVFGARLSPDVPLAGTTAFSPVAQFGEQPVSVEVSVSAPGAAGGLDVSIAQRAQFQSSENREGFSRGMEFRLGQRLEGLVEEFKTPSWDKPAWYFFAASDGQAVMWTPNVKTDAPFQLQDRITIGDLQAGFSVEAEGMQASLSYTQREVSNGQRTDEMGHVGFTFTWRR